MFYKSSVSVPTPHPGDDHAQDKTVTRFFIRNYTCPPAPHFIAPSLQGYVKRKIYRMGAPGLNIAYGIGSEQAMWYDPTDRKGEARKIVFT